MIVTLWMLHRIVPVDAAPLDNGWKPALENHTALSESYAPAWVAEPHYRGTWSILLSCTLTIFLAVFSALHLNTPAKDPSHFVCRYNLHKLKWALVALILPEVVLVTAFLQWHDALRLCFELEQLHSRFKRNSQIDTRSTAATLHVHDASSSSESIWESISSDAGQSVSSFATTPREPEARSNSVEKIVPFQGLWKSLAASRTKFPLKYGFYVGMGGFAIDMTPHKDRTDLPEFCRGSSRMTVTALGVIELARRDQLFLEVSTETISDKSKADIVAKALAIFQIFWMVVQFSARKSCKLPISLLEIHTLVHVFCALVMYCFWMQKPMGIKDPTILCSELADLVLNRQSTVAGRLHDNIAPRAHNLPQLAYELSPPDYFSLMAAVLFVSVGYGGAHLGAWDYAFPTEIDEQLWKASCIVMMVASLVMPFWVSIAHQARVFYLNQGKRVTETIAMDHRALAEGFFTYPLKIWRVLRSAVIYLFFAGSVVVIPAFVIARMVIVVECFLGMRKVPEGIYAKVAWSDYIPHL